MFARGVLVQQKRQDKSMYLPTVGADLNKAESSGPENSGCHSRCDWVKKALGSIWGNCLSEWEGFLFSAQKKESLLSFFSFGLAAQTSVTHVLRLSAGVHTPSTSHISKHVACHVSQPPAPPPFLGWHRTVLGEKSAACKVGFLWFRVILIN